MIIVLYIFSGILVLLVVAAVIKFIIDKQSWSNSTVVTSAEEEAGTTGTGTTGDVLGGQFGIVASDLTKLDLNLTAGETYTTPIQDVSGFGGLSVIVSMPPGTAGILYMDLVMDEEAKFVRTKTLTVGDLPTSAHTLSVISKYFRLRLTANTNITGAAFQTLLHGSGKHLTSTINETIADTNDAELVRSVITASTVSGDYKNVHVDSEGNLLVSIHDPASAFGEVINTTLTPIFQISSVYNYLEPQWCWFGKRLVFN